MLRPVAALALTASVLSLLSGCVGADPAPVESVSSAPIGPVPPAGGPLTLEAVAAIIGADDAIATATFAGGDAPSTSGADLASENDYWIAVGGRPDACAGVVSAPYLVSAADTGSRLDDPTLLIGIFTEVDEERFGLIQVSARQFDDAATASGFLTELTATVQGCPSYQLVDGDTVTWNAVALNVAPLADLPAEVAGVRYIETLQDSAALGVSTIFLQRDGVVLSIYGEITDTSTITQADVDALAAVVADRLGRL